MKTDYHCHILPGIDDGAKDITYTNDLRDALIERLRAAGIDVNTDWQEGERVLNTVNLKANSERNGAFSGDSSTNSKSFEGKVHLHRSSLSDSKDVAKLLNNLETLANFLEKVSNQRKNFIQEVANALGAESDGSKSEYKSFGTKNGLIVQADDYVDISEYYDIKKI